MYINTDTHRHTERHTGIERKKETNKKREIGPVFKNTDRNISSSNNLGFWLIENT